MNCCGFGHRQIFDNIDEQIYDYVVEAVRIGCDTFFTGDMGDFDKKFSSAVRRAKKKYPHIKLICVKPYLTRELQESKEYYYAMYDDIIIPTELADVHYKSIITKRNQWMIDNSDIVIGYTIRDYGGAYTAVKYAEKQNKKILYIQSIK